MGLAFGQNAQNKSVVNAMYVDALRQTFAEVKERGVQVQARHHEWFHGKPLVMGGADNFEHLVAVKMVERMVAKLKQVGTECHGEFAQKMSRFPHRMGKSIVAGMIPGHITHGVCRMGQVVDVNKNTLDVVRFFVTNGDIEIDPDMGDRYVRLKDRTLDRRMFFGVAVTLDRNGSFIRIDKDRFDNGVAFLTDKPNEALFNMSAVSTGKPVELFRNMAAQSATASQTGTVQPVGRPAVQAVQPRF